MLAGGDGLRGAERHGSTLPVSEVRRRLGRGSVPWSADGPVRVRGAPQLADDDLRRGALGLDFDDDGWESVPVPGHWRSVPAFASSDGPLLYRTRFELDPGPAGARHWVVLDGVFYQADVFLDGAYLGDPEGYFFPHSYEITDLARLGPGARPGRRGGVQPARRTAGSSAT